MDVKGIVKKYLEDNNLDGLVNEFCACDIENLFPCGMGECSKCLPAVRQEATEEERTKLGVLCNYFPVDDSTDAGRKLIDDLKKLKIKDGK